METTSAIVLRSTNYGDKDKILYLYSPEHGVFSARLRGVRQQGAKMKIFSLPFCFAEWELVSGKGDFYTVKGATLIEAFYDISKNIDHYCVACIMLDVLRQNVYYEDQSNRQIFMSLLKALRLMSFAGVRSKLVLCRFLLDVLRYNGVGMQVDMCGKCGMRLTNQFFFGTDGLIKCIECHQSGDMPLDAGIVACIKNLENIEYEGLGNMSVSEEILDKVLYILRRSIEVRLQLSLNFTEII